MKQYSSLKSNLSKAKNLGSGATGSYHWLMQRLTALLLIPLFIWLGFFAYQTSGKDLASILAILKKPVNIVACMLIILTSLYHSMLGMQVVIEDYISCLKLRNFLIIFLKLFTFVTSFTFLVALIYFIIRNG